MWYKALEYGRYLLKAKSKHGVHSPFVFDLLTLIYEDKTVYPEYSKVESLRSRLIQDNRILEIRDFGAANIQDDPNGILRQRTVKEIARSAAKSKFWAQFLFRLCRKYKPQTMLELGTSLGISGAYQIMGALQNLTEERKPRLITLEGSEAVADEAKANFLALGLLDYVSVIPGSFESTLDTVLADLDSLDFVFIDGNHRCKPTLEYFEKIVNKVHASSVVVFDDIHWSSEMTMAWETIKQYPQVTVSIDFFTLGLVFFRPGQVKEHFVLR